MPLNSYQAGQIFQPVPPALLAQLTAIYLFRGKQELYERQAPEVLASSRVPIMPMLRCRRGDPIS